MEDGVSRKAALSLSAALLFVLGVAGVLYWELHRLSDRVEQQRTFVLRSQVRDALLGRTLPDLKLPAVRGDSASLVRRGTRPHVIWTLDPDRCIQCLEGLGEWRRIARTPGVRAVVVLEGTDGSEAEGIVRQTALDGTVLYDSAGGWLRPSPGEEWPAMVVLGVEADGRIRSVASRESRGSCRWSAFDYSLSVVEGLVESGTPVGRSPSSAGG